MKKIIIIALIICAIYTYLNETFEQYNPDGISFIANMAIFILPVFLVINFRKPKIKNLK